MSFGSNALIQKISLSYYTAQSWREKKRALKDKYLLTATRIDEKQEC